MKKIDDICDELASFDKKIFVVIAGNIGSGKTTLTEMLSRRLGWHPYYESVADNPYLVDFYRDMGRWSFPLQIYFLSHRFGVHRAISSFTDNNSAIQDRSIYEDAHIFSRVLNEEGVMDRRDYENYQTLYRTVIGLLPPPTLMIFLRRSVPRLLERIHQRGRDYERDISPEYLTKLDDHYEEWRKTYNLGKSLTVDTEYLDFIEDPEHFNQLIIDIHETLCS
jgi:deoxyadenosine/deoxycytidine kinase